MKPDSKHQKNHLFKPFNGVSVQQTRPPVLGTRNSVHKDASGIFGIIPKCPLQMEMSSREAFTIKDKTPPKQNLNPFQMSVRL